MIAALVVVSLLSWGAWRWFGRVRFAQVPTVVAAPEPETATPTSGAWTALDEYQLVRLLTLSSPSTGSAPNPTDGNVPPVEPEGTP